MFDSYHSLVFSRSNPDSLPISDFRLTEGSVCADKQQYARSEGKPVYSLEVVEKGVDECTQRVGKFVNDERYIKAASFEEKEFYEWNQVDLKIKNLPDYYPEDSEYVWNLYYTPYFKWNPDCEKTTNRTSLNQDIQNLVKVSSLQIALMVICICYSVLLTIVFGFIKVVCFYSMC